MGAERPSRSATVRRLSTFRASPAVSGAVSADDLFHVVTRDDIPDVRKRLGKLIIRGSFLVLVAVAGAQLLQGLGVVSLGFTNWQPTFLAYVIWAVALCVGQVL